MSDGHWQSSYPPDQGGRFAKIKLMLARIFGDGENPLAWGFPIFTALGVQFRIHVLFIAYIVMELVMTIPGHRPGLVFVWPKLFAFFIIVLLHEFTRVFVARRHGSAIDRVMMWPLGGLTVSTELDSWKQNLWVSVSGYISCIVLLPIFGVALYVSTGSAESLLTNPLLIGNHLQTVTLQDGSVTWWLILFESLYAVNVLLLIINASVPMLPLDSANALYAYLLKNRSSMDARWLTANVGIWAATAIGLIGIIFEDGKMLLAVAIFGGIVCSMERRRLQFLRSGDLVPGYSSEGHESESWKQPSLVDEDDQEVIDQQELDRVLEKISISGMNALSRKEKRLLKRATESSRKSQ